jgi:hypothetical protein
MPAVNNGTDEPRHREGAKAMFPLKVVVILTALIIFGSSAALVGYDIYLAAQLNRLLPRKRTRQFGGQVNPKRAA